MENFTSYNPVKLHFGNNVIEKLHKAIDINIKKVLIVYGGGSIKKNGIYEKVINQLTLAKISFVEFEGIKPNPIVEDVELACEIVKKEKVDMILAVGGGSVIDSAKMIAYCSTGNYDVWQVMKSRQKPNSALPIITVLTLAATGTEMNPFAVLQNNNTKEKIGFGNPLMFPSHSFLDPNFTKTVPYDYTAYGISDLIAHSLEAYFGKGESPLTDKFIFSIIREAIEVGPELLENLNNYDLRARILWASTCALNGMTVYGKASGDWGVHDIGHNISFLFNTPHGATLSIAYPAWMKMKIESINQKLKLLGQEVFGIDDPMKTITAFEDFFKSIKCPVRLGELKLNSENIEDIHRLLINNKVSGYYHLMTEEDYPELMKLMT